jgi:hypothetical protein
VSSWASGEPACWKFFRDPNPEQLDVLFLHERINTAGKRRLVVIRGKPQDDGAPTNGNDRRPIRSVWYHARVFDLSSAGPRWWSQTNGKESDLGDLGNILDEKQGSSFLLGFIQSKRLVLLNGKPDDNDGSRFTIGFIHDGGTGQIDGWLDEQDCIHLAVRDSP